MACEHGDTSLKRSKRRSNGSSQSSSGWCAARSCRDRAGPRLPQKIQLGERFWVPRPPDLCARAKELESVAAAEERNVKRSELPAGKTLGNCRVAVHYLPG